MEANFLNETFKHPNWFVKRNEETNKYEPYLTNKLAIQYFASSGDFHLNEKGNAVKYDGREGGQFTGKQKIDYFLELRLEVEKSKEKAKGIAKQRLSEENKKLNYIENGMLIVMNFWSKDYTMINVSFLEYTQHSNPDYLKEIEITKL